MQLLHLHDTGASSDLPFSRASTVPLTCNALATVWRREARVMSNRYSVMELYAMNACRAAT